MVRKTKRLAEMGYWDHVDELRNTLIQMALLLIPVTVIAWFFTPDLMTILTAPYYRASDAGLIFIQPMEGFVTRLRIAMLSALLVTVPFLVYRFWMFLIRALYRHERRHVLSVLFFTIISFYAGVVFAYYVLPYSTEFFLSFATGMVENRWAFSQYLSYVIRIMLAFGIVFELPLVIALLAALKLVDANMLKKRRRHAILLFFVLAAIITPPDLFTQIMLAVPLVILYEISILVAAMLNRRQQQEETGQA